MLDFDKDSKMQYFNRIHVENFRRLSNLDLELRPLCVFIGANASGKTSLLDSFSLLANSAKGRLKKTLSDLGGIGSNLTDQKSQWMSFKLSKQTTGEKPIHYRLALGLQGVGYEIVDERLYLQTEAPPGLIFFKSEHGVTRYQSHPQVFNQMKFEDPRRAPEGGETALSADPGLFLEAVHFSKQLKSFSYYHSLDVSLRSPVRSPQPLQPAESPGVDGEDLVSCLYGIRESDRDQFELIEETLRSGFRDFERLEFPLAAAGTLSMTWRDKQFTKPFYAHQLSEGVLRFLWLVTILQSPQLPAVTLIDEPEVSLHPELLSLLAGLLREASQRTQLIVATHSDRLVRYLEPKEVVTFNLREDGKTEANWADTFDLDVWLKDYTLDALWDMGRMGGRS